MSVTESANDSEDNCGATVEIAGSDDGGRSPLIFDHEVGSPLQEDVLGRDFCLKGHNNHRGATIEHIESDDGGQNSFSALNPAKNIQSLRGADGCTSSELCGAPSVNDSAAEPSRKRRRDGADGSSSSELCGVPSADDSAAEPSRKRRRDGADGSSGEPIVEESAAEPISKRQTSPNFFQVLNYDVPRADVSSSFGTRPVVRDLEADRHASSRTDGM